MPAFASLSLSILSNVLQQRNGQNPAYTALNKSLRTECLFPIYNPYRSKSIVHVIRIFIAI